MLFRSTHTQLSTSLLELYHILPPLLEQTQELTSALDKHSQLIAQRLAQERENKKEKGSQKETSKS